MPITEGRITIVQEGRFHLVDGAGVGHAFSLSPHAAAEPAQLAALARSQTRVRVHASRRETVSGAVANRIVSIGEA